MAFPFRRGAGAAGGVRRPDRDPVRRLHRVPGDEQAAQVPLAAGLVVPGYQHGGARLGTGGHRCRLTTVDAGRASSAKTPPAPLAAIPSTRKDGLMATVANNPDPTLPAELCWTACASCGHLFPAAPEQPRCRDCAPDEPACDAAHPNDTSGQDGTADVVRDRACLTTVDSAPPPFPFRMVRGWTP